MKARMALVFFFSLISLNLSSSFAYENTPPSTRIAKALKTLSYVSKKIAYHWPNTAQTPIQWDFVENFEDFENLWGNKNYYTLQETLSEDEIIQSNKALLRLLKKNPSFYQNERQSSLSFAQAQNLRKHFDTQIILKDESAYDHTGEMGHCFFKATMIHLESLILGIDPGVIKKLWVVGNLSSKDYFHVVTMLPAKEGGYWVIEPNEERPLQASRWLENYRDSQPEAVGARPMFFVTQAGRVSLTRAVPYNALDLFGSNLDVEIPLPQSQDFQAYLQQWIEADFYLGIYRNYFAQLHPRFVL